MQQRWKLGAGLTGLLAVLALVVAWHVPNVQAGKDDTQAVDAARALGNAFGHVANRAFPAVVGIRVEKAAGSPAVFEGLGEDLDPFDMLPDALRRRFFESVPHAQPHLRRQPVVGQGSGFLIAPDGLILTNSHVVHEADRIRVKLHDGRELDGKLVGDDAQSDVALVRVDATNLPYLPLGDSDGVEVGEWVVAIGNPFGLSETVTSGIVSAKGRTRIGINDYEDFIQTDAAINPGNSGGPLLDLDGRVIGINSAIYSRSGGSMGIGFAIPVTMAKKIEERLLEKGVVTRAYLGVLMQDLTPDLAQGLGVHDRKGVLVAEVVDGSPAAKAGFQAGDVITGMADGPIADMTRLRNRVALLEPGTHLAFTVLRAGETRTLDAVLGTAPKTDEDATSAASPAVSAPLGLSGETITPETARTLGLDESTHGVWIRDVEPGSAADRAGLEPGLVVVSANRKAVHTAEELDQALKATPANGVVLLQVEKDGESRFVALRRE